MKILGNKINREDKDEIKLAEEYYKWVALKTRLYLDEKSFSIPEDKKNLVKRGNVFWIHFGFNVGGELGGRHPGIILRVGGKKAIVIPLSTQEPSAKQLESGIYVEIKKVYNFENLKRWVNTLDIIPISFLRLDFNDTIGNVKGWELDKIRDAVKANGLWKFQ